MNVSSGQFRLDEPSSVVFDSNGVGISYLGPNGARESWNIAFISVTSTSVNDVPTVKFYRGSVVPSNFVTGTFSGSLDVDSQPNLILRSGERFYAYWEGGDPGTVGTFRLEGTRVVV